MPTRPDIRDIRCNGLAQVQPTLDYSDVKYKFYRNLFPTTGNGLRTGVIYGQQHFILTGGSSEKKPARYPLL